MKWLLRILVLILLAAAGLATVEMFHPRGLVGAIEDWKRQLTEPPAPPPSRQPSPENGNPSEEPPTRKRGPGAEAMLRTAHSWYDRGDFEDASLSYLAAKAVAADAKEEDEAVRGARKALLAWALVHEAPPVNATPRDAEAECERRMRKLEEAPDERGWVELARYAAGAGVKEHLHYIAERALEGAASDGPVRTQIEAALPKAGNRTAALVAAMDASGFRRSAAPAPPAPVPPVVAEPPPAAKPPAKPPATAPGTAPAPGVRYGAFSDDMRKRLQEAVRLHQTGAEEYRLAGPDGTNRSEHRRKAIAAFEKAREIYDAALAEDPNSRVIQGRKHEVVTLIHQLHKDSPIDER